MAVKTRKAKTKSRSAAKETHNGLPSRVTSNGLVDNSTADIAGSAEHGAAASGKARKKSKSSKRNKTAQSAGDSQGKVDAARQREVTVIKVSALGDFTF